MKQQRVSIRLSRPAARMVDRLLREGLWGRSRAEVVQRLVYSSLEAVFRARERVGLRVQR